jgi:hypothetical protein
VPEFESEGTRCATLAYSKSNIKSKYYMILDRKTQKETPQDEPIDIPVGPVTIIFVA